ncbi:Central kinetochore subunit CHL4 [Wickerhamomyces ciferrii]|uniref:Central kinetochore subunit CHL4 n=1 Tax=Wickerhamomyces ciferrii (strain ATCC 14091 / BCRC 22168 / CBS 111 / JCM 3599 / NBRC 0793 / NRRL Y-1031 F-60-10) TaxID=1206466 RepID=K0KDX4_WICCF|nr:Central kinetochore subunit CHL4 [Wickerhamomyces ciferrii]CCH43280.1 Central kinetochore subunit CHL4 [Wickerhamomyces ciferrii]
MSHALRNSFIPKRSPTVISRILSRLSLDSLLNLCLLWCSMPITYPQLLQDQLDELEQTKEEYVQEFIDQIKHWKDKRTITKRKVIDRLLVDIYPYGLNLLQYAQIDSQLIVEKQSNYLYWQVSKLLDSKNQNYILNLHSPQNFLESLVGNLSKFFMNHIYISNHPYYPLIIIRIQIFDLIHQQNTPQIQKISNSLISRKPFFLALPQNSSNLIHSPISIDDQTSQIILQCISSSLSTSTSQIRILQQDKTPQLLKNLESLHILSGNSRFKESLGAWAPYADGNIDISPFDDVQDHHTLQKTALKDGDDEEEGSRIAKISKLRFRGTLNELKSKQLFEGTKKRKLDEDDEEETLKNGFKSIAPVQQVEFNIKQDFKTQRPKLKLKLHGNDVFAGLFELCSKGKINPEDIPGWLTGEEGYQNGDVIDGIFQKNDDKDGVLI